jgi:hypothetical protein
MPGEVLALLIITLGIVFILSIIRITQNHELKKIELRASKDADDSLTTSELQQMIEDAVSKATGPIGDDLELLSARIDQIDGGGGRILLEGEDSVQEKTLGRSVRQREG